MTRASRKSDHSYSLLRWLTCGTVVAMVAAGWLAADWRGRHVDAQLRERLLCQAGAVARTINLDRVKALTFTPADKGSPAFERLREELTAYGRLCQARGIHSIALREGKLVFGPESYATSDPLASPAGTIYEQPATEEFGIFRDGKPVALGPYSNEYGQFVVAYAPVIEPRTGQTLMAMGLAIPAADWKTQVSAARTTPIVGTLLLVAIAFLGLTAIHWRSRLPQASQMRFRWIEIAMVAALALVVTMAATWLTWESETHQQQQVFERLTDSHAEFACDEFFGIRDNLAALSRYCGASKDLDREEFHALAASMATRSPVWAYAWVEARPDEESASTPEAAMRYTVRYVDSQAGNEANLTLDLGPGSKLRAVFDKAARLGLAVTSDPSGAIRTPEGQEIMLAIQPAYSRDQAGKQALQGFAVAAIGPKNILDRITGRMGQSTDLIEWHLVDPAGAGGPTLLAVSGGGDLKHPKIVDAAYLSQYSSRSTYPVFTLGKAYAVMAHPTSAFNSVHPFRTVWLVAGCGVVLTAVVTAFVGFLRNRQAVLERQVHDRTTRLQASEEAARTESSKLSAMIAGMEEGVVFANADGVIVEINEFLCRFVGKGRSEILGLRLEDLHTGSTREGILHLIDSFRGDCASRPFLTQKTIGPAEVLMRMQPIYRDGTYDGVLLNVIDVTELTRAKKNIEARNLELDKLNQDFEQANRQLEQAVGRANELAVLAESASLAKSEFLANMSHEIRTPLTAILGYAELSAEAGISEPERLEHSKVILRNGRHLLELINDILDISKIEAGKMVLEHRPTSVHAVVADVVSMMRVRAIEKRLTLTARFETALPQTIVTDEARLRQTLINLVGNALKFTQAGEVSISAALAEKGVDGLPAIRIAVRDTGIGMSPESLGRLFQPFTQADSSTTRKYGGTGLGLTITKRILESMGGDVEVHSTPGEGSVFTLVVPTGALEGVPMVDPAAEIMTWPAPVSACDTQARPLTGLKVLLAEDGPDNQVLIRTVLTRAGAQVHVVGNGRLALQAVGEQAFDVILMDMQMPEMDGYEAAEALRTSGCRTPIIALTAHALSGDRDRCVRAGCTDYVTKPVNRGVLIDRILRQTTRPLAQSPCSQAPADPVASAYADDEDLGEILESFVAGLPDRCQAMRDALDNGDLPRLSRLAHQLKGAGGGYGYPSLTQAGLAVEVAARAVDVETCRLELHNLTLLCQAIGRGLKRV